MLKHKVFLLGYPLTSSWSPVMQQAAFLACGLQGSYQLCSVPPRNFELAVARLHKAEVLGANVTMPYKQEILQYLAEIDPAARSIGAVNTVVRRGQDLVGYNTDVHGAVDTLRSLQSGGKQVMLLGAGGAARAVLAALCQEDIMPAKVCIINRSKVRLELLTPWLATLPY